MALYRHVAPMALYRHVAPIALYRHVAPMAIYRHATPMALYSHAAPIGLYRHDALMGLYRHIAPMALYRHDAPMGLCGCGVPAVTAENWLDSRSYLPRTSPLPSTVEARSPAVRAVPRPPRKDTESAAEFGESFAGERYFRNLRLSPAIEED